MTLEELLDKMCFNGRNCHDYDDKEVIFLLGDIEVEVSLVSLINNKIMIDLDTKE